MFKNRRSKLLLFLSMLVICLPSLEIHAEESTGMQIESINIQVMPEYAHHPEDKKTDEPSVLVGEYLYFKNTSGKDLEAGQLSYPIPTNAKGFRLGYVGDSLDNEQAPTDVKSTIDEEHGMIVWQSSKAIKAGEGYKVLIEYYLKDLPKDQNRKYKYELNPRIKGVPTSILFYEPMGSKDYKISPKASSIKKDNNGQNLYLFEFPNLSEKQVFEVSYVKKDTKTTMDYVNEMMGNPEAHGIPMKEKKVEKMNTTNVVGSLSAGSLVIVGGLLIYLKRKKNRMNKGE